jgi:hypothetical protein
MTSSRRRWQPRKKDFLSLTPPHSTGTDDYEFLVVSVLIVLLFTVNPVCLVPKIRVNSKVRIFVSNQTKTDSISYYYWLRI